MVHSGGIKHLVLIDGHHLMYRAYWAIPRTLKNGKGEQVNTVFGFASILINILKTEQPDALLFCFDEGEDTFRHKENATYKEGRAETPDDFYVQIPRVQQLIIALGFPHVSSPKYEADDFLCAYATAAEKEGMRVTIVTGDRDAFQLATENVKVAIPHSGYQKAEYLGPAEIFTKYGIRPDQVPAYKGLTGDASDNLPGVHGIGPKTAASLLQQFNTLENLYEHLEDVKPTVRAKLEKDREQAFFCQRMARLVCDIPLTPSLANLALESYSTAHIFPFFKEMEFTLLERRFRDLLATPYGKQVWPEGAPSVQVQARDKATDQLTLF